jgi:hypothetical protein
MRYVAVTCYKNYGTPLNSTGAPVTRTGHALASEIVSWRAAVHRGPKNKSGNWRCRMSWSAGCTLWDEVYWHIRDPKKVRPKNCILSRRFIKTWLSNIHRPLLRKILLWDELLPPPPPTERNKDLSVIVFIKPAASGDNN